MSRAGRLEVLVVGPLPPPANGMTIMTAHVLACGLDEEFNLVHVDTSDHREIAAIERLEPTNVWLAVRHGVAFVRALARRPSLAYLPIARKRLGFLRDSVFLLSARLFGVTRVVHFHGSGFREFYDSERRILRALIRAALGGDTHAIVLGRSRLGELAGLVHPDRIHVVPNGIPDHSSPHAADRPREREVLHLGTLREKKGLFDLLEAARLVSKELPETRFLLAGEWGSQRDRDRALGFIRQHRLEQAIVLVGPVAGARKIELLERAAVAAFPSYHEGQPVVLLESFCSGTPAVATRVGCIPETLRDGCEGFLIDPGDSQALAERLSRLLTDEPLRARMGHAARRRYESHYTLDQLARGIGKSWRRAAGGGTVAESAISDTVKGDATP